MPWFQNFEPTVSWKRKELEGRMVIRTKSKTSKMNATTMATSWAIENSKKRNHDKKEDVPE